MDRYDEADADLQTAWFISYRSLGANDPRTVQFVTERGMVRIAQGQATLGLEHLRKAESLTAGSLPEEHPLRQQIMGAIWAGLELQKRLGT